KGNEVRGERGRGFPDKEEESSEEGKLGSTVEFGQVFCSPLGSIGLEAAEQAAMQQQIVDMYMRSMQQFTDSLANMKLPMELDKPGDGGDHHQGKLTRNSSGEISEAETKKKDSARVFYGSRAFF
ncbi:hypothetical protein U1Q18_050541, partial [Sarracenia purpurea var. burkii]